MENSDGRFCLPACVIVCEFYMCIYREQCLSYFTEGWNNLSGTVFPKVLYFMYLFVVSFNFGLCASVLFFFGSFLLTVLRHVTTVLQQSCVRCLICFATKQAGQYTNTEY